MNTPIFNHLNMNVLVLSTFGIFVILYLAYRRNRNHHCAFALWFPLSATFGIGTLIWFFSIPVMLSRGGHVTGGIEACAAGIVFIVLLICPVISVRTFKERPPLALLTNSIILTTLFIYIATLGLLYYASLHLERSTIEVTLLNTKGEPVPNAEITYYSSASLAAFFVKELRGKVSTDVHGSATIPMQRSHKFSVTFAHDGFYSLMIDTNPKLKGEALRNFEISWVTPDVHGREGHFNIRTADTNRIRLFLYMPQKGAYEPPPYPGYKETIDWEEITEQ